LLRTFCCVPKDRGDFVLTLQLSQFRFSPIHPLEIDLGKDAIGRVIAKPMGERRPPARDSNDNCDQEDETNREAQRNVAATQFATKSGGPGFSPETADPGCSCFTCRKDSH
jgi:hypothetical protein